MTAVLVSYPRSGLVVYLNNNMCSALGGAGALVLVRADWHPGAKEFNVMLDPVPKGTRKRNTGVYAICRQHDNATLPYRLQCKSVHCEKVEHFKLTQPTIHSFKDGDGIHYTLTVPDVKLRPEPVREPEGAPPAEADQGPRVVVKDGQGIEGHSPGVVVVAHKSQGQGWPDLRASKQEEGWAPSPDLNLWECLGYHAKEFNRLMQLPHVGPQVRVVWDPQNRRLAVYRQIREEVLT